MENTESKCVCPNCGYCLHCGRGGFITVPWVPTYPVYPPFPTYPSPWYPNPIWISTPSITTTNVPPSSDWTFVFTGSGTRGVSCLCLPEAAPAEFPDGR